MLTSLLERLLLCIQKEQGAQIWCLVNLAERHDPELGLVLRSMAERINGPTVDLEAKRIARNKLQAGE